MLGFSKVDRFKTPIKLYPERFITADRILKAKAIPDLDNNIDRQEPFVKAFRDELGEHGIYPMIAFGALKKSSAIKLYMGAEGVEASIQNEVTKQLKEYDKAIKHCETEEEKEHIDIADYIDKKYHKYIELSKPYQGIIIQKSFRKVGILLGIGYIVIFCMINLYVIAYKSHSGQLLMYQTVCYLITALVSMGISYKLLNKKIYL